MTINSYENALIDSQAVRRLGVSGLGLSLASRVPVQAVNVKWVGNRGTASRVIYAGHQIGGVTEVWRPEKS